MSARLQLELTKLNDRACAAKMTNQEVLHRAAMLGAHLEREDCARIAEEDAEGHYVAKSIAHRIRARKNEDAP